MSNYEWKLLARRATAGLVDLLVLLVSITIIGTYLFLLQISLSTWSFLLVIASVYLSYCWIFPIWTWEGSLGERVAKVRVTMHDGNPVTFTASYSRLVVIALVLTLGVGLSAIVRRSIDFSGFGFTLWVSTILAAFLVFPVSIVLSPGAGLHDSLAGTTVVASPASGGGRLPSRYGRPLFVVQATAYSVIISLIVVSSLMNYWFRGNLGSAILLGGAFEWMQEGTPDEPNGQPLLLRLDDAFTMTEGNQLLLAQVFIFRLAPKLPIVRDPKSSNVSEEVVNYMNTLPHAWTTVIGVAKTGTVFEHDLRESLSSDIGLAAFERNDRQRPFVHITMTYPWTFGPVCYSRETETIVIMGQTSGKLTPVPLKPLSKVQRFFGLSVPFGCPSRIGGTVPIR